MVVILEAVSGPVTGRRIEIRAGSILRIGRTAKSDYALSEDSYLSGQHFAVECDGTQARVRDLGSSNGTFINGNRITEHVAQEGDSLTAGGSTFTIHLESAASGSPPPIPTGTALGKTAQTPLYTAVQTIVDRPGSAATAAAATQPWPGFSRAQTVLLQTLFGTGAAVFAVVDATRDSRIPAFLDASGEPFLPIDPTGRAQAFVAAPAPHSRLLDVLIKDGWGRGWCSYFNGLVTLEVACAHLAGFATLYTVQSQPFTFRFWDPRVLRALAPLMSAEEGAAFFGPFTRMIAEGEKPEIAVELSMTPRGPRQQTIVLL